MIAIIEWFKANWKGLGYPLAAVFAFLWWNKSCPQVESAPVVTATQSQAVTQTAKASVQVKLVYRDRIVEVPGEAPRSLPSPCPDVIVDADASENQAHWQSQSVTVTPQKAVQGVQSAIFIGGGYLSGPILAGGYRRDILTLQAIGWTDKIGGLATVDLIRFQ